jgi:hypothetical protein
MRAVRATLDTGLPVAGVEVDLQGKIRVIVGHPGTEAGGNELERRNSSRGTTKRLRVRQPRRTACS